MTLHKHQNTAPHDATIITTPSPHQTWIELSTTAFNHNAAYYKNKIGAHNNLAVVIKGNGYGHGLQQIASLCEQNENIDWMCVAQLSEALALENIAKPIIVLGYSDINPEYAVHKNIHFMVDHREYAHALNAIGKKYSYQFNVHVKIDTGLSRMGVAAQEALDFIRQLEQLDYIRIAGIYSHFAASDSNPIFTEQQRNIYDETIALLQAHNINIRLLHMSNSGSIAHNTYSQHCNFFRIGLGMYGLGIERDKLQPVMTWKSRVANIKSVPAQASIGYANSFTTQRPTRIALVPVGYYDGYKFGFSNKASVMINGTYASVLGRVAMNMTIVDATDMVVDRGDEVVLLGSDEKINPHTLATLAEIQNVREIITGINPTIARVITP